MSDDEDVEEWVLEEVHERTEPDPDSGQDHNGAAWTSLTRLRGDGRKFSVPYSESELEQAVNRLQNQGKLVYWNGLLCPATEQHLKAVIESERTASVTRAILIGQLNELLQQTRDTATTGGEVADA